MDPVSQIIVLNIGNVVAWLAALYVQGTLRGLIGNVIVSTIGAFAGGLLALQLLPKLDKPGMIVGAFAGAALLLYLVRLKPWHWSKNGG